MTIMKQVQNNKQPTTTFKTKNLSGLQLENFINFQEIGHSVDYYEEGKKYKVIGINKSTKELTITGVVELNKEKIMKWIRHECGPRRPHPLPAPTAVAKRRRIWPA